MADDQATDGTMDGTSDPLGRLPLAGSLAGVVLGTVVGASFAVDVLAAGFATVLRLLLATSVVGLVAAAATARRPREERVAAEVGVALARATTVLLVAVVVGTVLDAVARVAEGGDITFRVLGAARLGTVGFTLGSVGALVVVCTRHLPRPD